MSFRLIRCQNAAQHVLILGSRILQLWRFIKAEQTFIFHCEVSRNTELTLQSDRALAVVSAASCQRKLCCVAVNLEPDLGRPCDRFWVSLFPGAYT